MFTLEEVYHKTGLCFLLAMLINCISYLGDYTNLYDQDNSFYCQDTRKFPVAQSEFFINQGVKATIQCAFKDGEMITGLVRFDEA